MFRVAFAMFSLALLHLGSSQVSQECTDAQMVLQTSTTCTTALDAGTSVNTICRGICRSLFDDIIINCDAYPSITSVYTTLIIRLCPSPETTDSQCSSNPHGNPLCYTAYIHQGLCNIEACKNFIKCFNDAGCGTGMLKASGAIIMLSLSLVLAIYTYFIF